MEDAVRGLQGAPAVICSRHSDIRDCREADPYTARKEEDQGHDKPSQERDDLSGAE